ncbi:MAG: hypothetical protein FRX49_10892 [Trebouxia sp. A1-2]|nr:MAG: hypothetical protein FRX49_10892 [Trebouxia sp. A1-2]
MHWLIAAFSLQSSPPRLLLLTAPTLPVAPPPPPAHTPTWVWDNSEREPYAHALLSGPCQALIGSVMSSKNKASHGSCALSSFMITKR